MDYTILKFCKLGIVPAVSGAYKITCDTLNIVNIVTVTFRTLCETLLSILVSAIHATVAVMVDGTVTDIISVHKIHYITYGLWIVGGVAVNLHIEYVTASGKLVIRSLNLGLVTRRALIIYGDMIGIGIVNLVSHTGNNPERTSVS